MTSIYCLFSTEDGRPRYIGQTTQPVPVRHAQHLRDARRQPASALHRWIVAVLKRGFQVRAHQLQLHVHPADLNLFEQYWMSQFSGLLNTDSNRDPAGADTATGLAVHRALRHELQRLGPLILGRMSVIPARNISRR